MDYTSLIPPKFSGVVSVRDAAGPLFEQAFGFADLPNQVPNTVDTRFGTASAGKLFVAAGILRLIEQGRLGFERTLGQLLGLDWRRIDPGITVRQLLNHTSGIPDYFDESVMAEYADLFVDTPNYRIRTSADLLPFFIDKPMMYPRGARFQYNNTGYVVLGLIIEAVCGVPFDAFLAGEVFAPCGMADTGYFELDRLPARCANAYIWDAARGEYYTNIYSIDAKGTGAGGAFTTAGDVARLWQGLYGGQVIGPEMLAQMTAPQVDEGCYGYGVWLRQAADGGLIPWFQGSDPGVSFVSSFSPRQGRVVTLLSNFGDDVWAVSRALTEAAEAAAEP